MSGANFERRLNAAIFQAHNSVFGDNLMRTSSSDGVGILRYNTRARFTSREESQAASPHVVARNERTSVPAGNKTSIRFYGAII